MRLSNFVEKFSAEELVGSAINALSLKESESSTASLSKYDPSDILYSRSGKPSKI